VMSVHHTHKTFDTIRLIQSNHIDSSVAPPHLPSNDRIKSVLTSRSEI
jgi:hypothetical protein